MTVIDVNAVRSRLLNNFILFVVNQIYTCLIVRRHALYVFIEGSETGFCV